MYTRMHACTHAQAAVATLEASSTQLKQDTQQVLSDRAAMQAEVETSKVCDCFCPVSLCLMVENGTKGCATAFVLSHIP